MNYKHCPLCQQNLPKEMFTSTRAKRCNNCKLIHQLTLRQEMTQRALERSKTKKQKTKTILSISELKKQVQKLANKVARERDKDLPCISCQGDCGLPNGGHFVAQGSSGALRYNLDNIHKQGVGCNKWNHGNLLEYRINLVKKIGVKKVEWLEEHRHDVKKWTREELLDLKVELEALLEEYETRS